VHQCASWAFVYFISNNHLDYFGQSPASWSSLESAAEVNDLHFHLLLFTGTTRVTAIHINFSIFCKAPVNLGSIPATNPVKDEYKHYSCLYKVLFKGSHVKIYLPAT